MSSKIFFMEKRESGEEREKRKMAPGAGFRHRFQKIPNSSKNAFTGSS
jgi:hypothetical protein